MFKVSVVQIVKVRRSISNKKTLSENYEIFMCVFRKKTKISFETVFILLILYTRGSGTKWVGFPVTKCNLICASGKFAEKNRFNCQEQNCAELYMNCIWRSPYKRFTKVSTNWPKSGNIKLYLLTILRIFGKICSQKVAMFTSGSFKNEVAVLEERPRNTVDQLERTVALVPRCSKCLPI